MGRTKAYIMTQVGHCKNEVHIPRLTYAKNCILIDINNMQLIPIALVHSTEWSLLHHQFFSKHARWFMTSNAASN